MNTLSSIAKVLGFESMDFNKSGVVCEATQNFVYDCYRIQWIVEWLYGSTRQFSGLPVNKQTTVQNRMRSNKYSAGANDNRDTDY